MPKKKSKKETTSKKNASSSPKISQKQEGVKPKEGKRFPINHFEIPFDDLERTKKFYGSIFGWGFVDMPEMDYTMVYTTEIDKNQMPTTPGAVNGGFTKRNPHQNSPTLVMTVDSVDETSKLIEATGGELLSEVIHVGDMGLYQLFKDPEGNVMGIYQVLKM